MVAIESNAVQRDAMALFRGLVAQHPAVTLTGPRQSGKTTLAKQLRPDLPYVSLEDPDQRRFATEDPRGFLAQYAQGAIFDEVQRCPELPSYLQTLIDADPQPGRFVLTGSQQFELMRSVTQSLAGRNGLLRLLPFSYAELCRLRPECAQHSAAEVIFSGFYPRIHHRRLNPSQALSDYFASYVQRDLRELQSVHNLQLFERFVRLCAARSAQLLNIASLAADAGVSHTTATQWLSLLQTSCIVHLLPPWFTNTTKRLTKAPKLFFIDTGLAAWLLDIRSAQQLSLHPLWGHLFENFVVMEALKDQWHRGLSHALYHYRSASGHEVDLLFADGAQVHALEVKAGATVNPDYFKGLHQFAKDFPEQMASGKVLFGGSGSQLRSPWPALSWQCLSHRPA
jgi:uncharacterized protein